MQHPGQRPTGKNEFLATLAHELRNPLAPIRNALQILRLSGDNRQAMEQSRVIMERQVNQMVRLVDDLLDVSRINRNKLDLRKPAAGRAGGRRSTPPSRRAAR